MKNRKIYLIASLIYLVLFPIALHSQINVQSVSYPDENSYGRAVVQKDSLNFVVIIQGADYHRIVKTTNGGASYFTVFEPPANTGVVHLCNKGDTIIAAGALSSMVSHIQSKIFRSTNFGTNWSEVQSPPGMTYTHFINKMPQGKLWLAAKKGNMSYLWQTDYSFTNYMLKDSSDIGSFGKTSAFSLDTVYVPVTAYINEDMGNNNVHTETRTTDSVQIRKTFNNGNSWMLANTNFKSIMKRHGGSTSYVTNFHCIDANNCHIFLGYYTNVSVYTTDGFQTSYEDTLFMSTWMKDWITCFGGKQYLFHSMADGSPAYIQECSVKPNGRLQLGLKTYLNMYATNISLHGRQAIVVGSGGEIKKITGLCGSTIGIDEDTEELTEGIMIYPNPVSDYLNFFQSDTDAGTEWKIYNVTGQLMMEGNNSAPVNISRFAQGVYFVKIKSANKFYLQKFVKIK
jgi:hypothetical protein